MKMDEGRKLDFMEYVRSDQEWVDDQQIRFESNVES